ncbi:MAG: ABC transporter permease, partial [Anaerococcus obesiensis]
MKKFNFNFKNLSILILILIFWQFIYKIGLFSPIYLPGPFKVFETFCAMLVDGSIFANLFASLFRVFIGYFLAFLVSFFLALIFYLKPKT